MIYGAGQEYIAQGFLLLLAGIPVYVYLKWRQAVHAESPVEAERPAARPAIADPPWRLRKQGQVKHPVTHAPSTSEGSAQRAPLTGVHSEVGTLRRVHPAPARPRAQAAHPAQQGRAAVRRRPVGASAPARSTTRSPTRSPTAASRCSTSTTCSPSRSATDEVRAEVLDAHARRGRPRARLLGPSVREWLDEHRRRRAGHAADRRHHRTTSCRSAQRALARAGAGARRLRARAAAQPPVHARHVRLDLRRRVDQRDGDSRRAGARAIHLDAIYRHHPLFADAGVPRLERRARRRRHSSRAATSSSSATAACSSAWASAPGRPASSGSRSACSPPARPRQVIAVALPAQRSTMHLDTVMTMVDRDAFTIYPDVRDELAGRYTLRPSLGRRHRRSARTTCSTRSPARSTSRGCGCSRPAATATRPSASSGTTATTCSPSRPASSSPTSATSTPTPGCAAPGSRSSRSPASSSAAAAAAPAACPARSSAETCRHDHPRALRTAEHLLRIVRPARPASSRELLDLAAAMKRRPAGVARVAARPDGGVLTSRSPRPARGSRSRPPSQRLGGLPLMLRPDELQLGRGEPIADTARVLSGVLRGDRDRARSRRRTSTRVAAASTSPVINALTDEHHPCQALADLLTLREHFGQLDGLAARLHRRRQQRRPLADGGGRAGGDGRRASPRPPGYEPDAEIVAGARARPRARTAAASGSSMTRTRRSTGAHAVYTDVWVSMGDEADAESAGSPSSRRYQVTPELMAAAPPRTPCSCTACPRTAARRSTAEVIDGPQSVVWQQAANRLPTEQALVYALITGDVGRSIGHARSSSRSAATPCCGAASPPTPTASAGTSRAPPRRSPSSRRDHAARRHPRQRPAGRAARAAGRGRTSGRALPARRAGRRDARA